MDRWELAEIDRDKEPQRKLLLAQQTLTVLTHDYLLVGDSGGLPALVGQTPRERLLLDLGEFLLSESGGPYGKELTKAIED